MRTNELVMTILLVSAVTIFFTLKSKKEKNSAWKGELIKKKELTDEDGENHVYRLIFKKEDGKKVKVRVSEETYNQSQMGDKFEKIKGEYIPRKI